jgi:hypothetical protein
MTGVEARTMRVKDALDELDRLTKDARTGKKMVAVAVSEAFALGMKCGTETANMNQDQIDALRAELDEVHP